MTFLVSDATCWGLHRRLGGRGWAKMGPKCDPQMQPTVGRLRNPVRGPGCSRQRRRGRPRDLRRRRAQCRRLPRSVGVDERSPPWVSEVTLDRKPMAGFIAFAATGARSSAVIFDGPGHRDAQYATSGARRAAKAMASRQADSGA